MNDGAAVHENSPLIFRGNKGALRIPFLSFQYLRRPECTAQLLCVHRACGFESHRLQQLPALSSKLPPKRKCWQSEDYQMGIFDAAAVGVAYVTRRSRFRHGNADVMGSITKS